jgi:hypothetical protein
VIGKLNYNYLLLLFIPLILSAFTHLWNPIGFPAGPSNDESIYIRRAVYVLNGFSPQENLLYDHPYFLQLFLAGILWSIGYPDSLNPSFGSTHSVEMFYTVPRIIAGILAIVDTFLVFRIAEKHYKNKNIAFIASLIFAVMPITLITRRVLLESVQLPFILLSILFAVYANEKIKKGDGHDNGKINVLVLTALSGISLGLAIFTKVPALIFIPLVMYLILSNAKIKENIRLALTWLSSAMPIPSIWPLYALHLNQFNDWIKGVFWQSNRKVQTFFISVKFIFNMDPIFMSIGIIGFIFAAIKRDLLILLWIVPFLLLLYVLGFVSIWHLLPVFPAFSIASAKMIVDISNMIAKRLKKNENTKILPFLITGAIGVAGLMNTASLISVDIDVNKPYFEAAAFVINYLDEKQKDKVEGKIGNTDRNMITVISNPFYSWIPNYIYKMPFYSVDYLNAEIAVKTKKILMVSDPPLKDRLNSEWANDALKDLHQHADKVVVFDDNNPLTNNKVEIYIHE